VKCGRDDGGLIKQNKTKETIMPTDLEKLTNELSHAQKLTENPEAAKTWKEANIKESKQLRVEMDAVLQKLKAAPGSRERALSITKLQEAIMWLGMDLKERGAANPYPNSYNPANAVVEPTADGMKM
jgi:hypothetical protein